MPTQTNLILRKLEHLEADVAIIKRAIVDPDLRLSPVDVRALQHANADFKAGRTVRLT